MGNDYWCPPQGCSSTESIGIVTYFPRHFKGEELDPAGALKIEHLQTCDLSAVRLSWSCPREIIEHVVGPTQKRHPEEQPFGLLAGTVGDVQSIKTRDGKQAFDVIEYGMRDIPGHLGLGKGVPNAERRLMRSELVSALLDGASQRAMQSIQTCCSWVRSKKSSHPTPVMHQVE